MLAECAQPGASLDGVALAHGLPCNLAVGELVAQFHAADLAYHFQGDRLLVSPAENFSRQVEHPGQFSVGTTLKNWSIFNRRQQLSNRLALR